MKRQRYEEGKMEERLGKTVMFESHQNFAFSVDILFPELYKIYGDQLCGVD